MTTTRPSVVTIVSFFAITIFFWSSSLVAIRMALPSYSPGALALGRYLIASIGMIFFYWGTRKKQLKWRDVPLMFLIGALGFSIYNVFLNYGEVTVNAGVAGFIVSQIPVVLTILAILFLGERLPKLAWLGIVVSVMGVLIIAVSHQSPTGGFDLGIVWLIVAVFSAAIYHVIYKKLLQRYHAIELTAYAIWGGTLSILFYLPTLWAEIPNATVTANWSMVYLGVFPGLIGYMTWGYALKYVPASKASSAFYTIPIVTAILGWICLGEVPAWLALLGGLLALVGAVIVAKAGTAKTPLVEESIIPAPLLGEEGTADTQKKD
jgi:drug/metabolite transporter (DMT)-like permease